jgi:DNA-directed RNA polymerase subunit beta'
LIPAGTGLAYHDARKRAAVAGGVPAKEIPAEALFTSTEDLAVEVVSETEAE